MRNRNHDGSPYIPPHLAEEWESLQRELNEAHADYSEVHARYTDALMAKIALAEYSDDYPDREIILKEYDEAHQELQRASKRRLAVTAARHAFTRIANGIA